MLGRGSVIGALSVFACFALADIFSRDVHAQQPRAALPASGSAAPAEGAPTAPPGSEVAPSSSSAPGATPPGSSAPAGSAAAPGATTAPVAPAAPTVAPSAAAETPPPRMPAASPAAPAVAPAGPASATLTASPDSAVADKGSDAAQDGRAQPPTTLGPELLGGGGFRLDGGPDGFAQHTAGDFNFGLGLWAAFDRENSFGLVYQRVGLGSARTVPTGSSVSAAYDLNVIWAALRLHPIRTEHTRLFAGLQVGLGWQDIQANGVRLTGEVVVARPFVCSVSSGPTFSIGPTAGLDIDVDRHFGFITELGAAAHAISGDVVDGCAPGAGSAITLAGRVGLVYRFDADRIFGEQSGNRATARR